jgi:hypothetical protein
LCCRSLLGWIVVREYVQRTIKVKNYFAAHHRKRAAGESDYGRFPRQFDHAKIAAALTATPARRLPYCAFLFGFIDLRLKCAAWPIRINARVTASQ